MVELIFADEDIRVVAVSDGNQAIASVEEQPPDIVLADVGMSGKTERVAERVLERLSDRSVRETVAGLVSAVAERLVREEIDRIKASVK